MFSRWTPCLPAWKRKIKLGKPIWQHWKKCKNPYSILLYFNIKICALSASPSQRQACIHSNAAPNYGTIIYSWLTSCFHYMSLLSLHTHNHTHTLSLHCPALRFLYPSSSSSSSFSVSSPPPSPQSLLILLLHLYLLASVASKRTVKVKVVQYRNNINLVLSALFLCLASWE